MVVMVAMNPIGDPEDKTLCVVEVADSRGWRFHQCKRKRGFGPDGLYCRQHIKRKEKRQRTLEVR